MSDNNGKQMWCDLGSHYVPAKHMLKSYGHHVCDACTLRMEQLVDTGIFSDDIGGLLWWLGYDIEAIKKRRNGESQSLQ